MVNLESISLFSNCGAGDVGFARAGFRFRVLAEIDERRLDVALRNHPDALGVAGDLRETWRDVVASYGEGSGSAQPTLLSACPPCQGMSSARSGLGHEYNADAGTRDARNLLVEVIADVAKRVEPRIVVVENVPAFLSRLVVDPHTGEPISAAALLIRLLEDHYSAYPFLTDLADYGIPQRRVRAFLTFIRHDELGLKLLERAALVPYPCASDHLGSSAPKTLGAALAALNARPLDAKRPADARDDSNPMHAVPVWGRHSPIPDGCRDSTRWPGMAELAVRAMRRGRCRTRGRRMSGLYGTAVTPGRPSGRRLIQARQGLQELKLLAHVA